jgi:hypothetical protein
MNKEDIINKNKSVYENNHVLKSKGYILSKKRDHPYRNNKGYVFTHRLIYEHYLKILFDEDVYIPVNYHVHHENGIKDDNRLINLSCLSSSEHFKTHHKNRKNN